MRGVIDDRGRLFGRLNLIDAAIIAFILVLVPVAYASFLVFRPAKPTITSLDRARMSNVEERAAAGTVVDAKLKIHGSGFRPTLRAVVGDRDAVGFLFETPTSADVLIGEMPGGTYDLILYDGVQEVARLPKAVVVPPKAPPGSATVLAVGAFVDMDQTTASSLKVGDAAASRESGVTIEALGPVESDYRRMNSGPGFVDVAVDGRVRRRAAVRVPCEVGGGPQCRVDGAPIGGPDRPMLLDLPAGRVRMIVDEFVPTAPPVLSSIVVRFVGYSAAIDQMKVGDHDQSWLSLDRRGAVIASLGRRTDGVGQIALGGADDRFGAGLASAITDRVTTTDGVIRAGLDSTPSGWRYRTQGVKLGATLTFTTERYAIRGSIVSIDAAANGQAGTR